MTTALPRGNIAAMEVQEALRLLELEGHGAALTADTLRRQYLRLALRTHPDKAPDDPLAAEKFAALGAAHELLLQALAHDASVLREQEHAAALLAVLLRALQGQKVEEELRAMGEYRPPSEFGVDLSVPFDRRVRPPPPRRQRQYSTGSSGSGSGSNIGPEGLQEVFREAFEQEGLTEEGDPLAGYELPFERDV